MDKQLQLIGLTKKEILKKMGDEFNFYPDKKWVYTLKKYWLGKQKKLIIEFDDEDKAVKQYTKSTYEK